MTFAERMIQTIAALGGVEAASEKSDVGEGGIEAMMTGHRYDDATVTKIAVAAGVSPDWLITGMKEK
jgi:hypothetical protein